MPEVGPPIRLLVVDDEDVVLAGVRAIVETADDIRVCGEARSVREAGLQARVLEPVVALVSAELAGGRGVDAAREIREAAPDVRVVMWSATADEQQLFGAILAGVTGYLLRRVKAPELLSGIRAVARGGSLLDPTLTGSVLDRVRHERALLVDERFDRLSAREQGILELVAAGRTNRQIAEQIHLAEKTVKNHLTRILAKLEVARRSEAAAYYARHSRL